MQARSQTLGGRGGGGGGCQIGQIWGPFMITRGLSCDRVGCGHFFFFFFFFSYGLGMCVKQIYSVVK